MGVSNGGVLCSIVDSEGGASGDWHGCDKVVMAEHACGLGIIGGFVGHHGNR